MLQVRHATLLTLVFSILLAACSPVSKHKKYLRSEDEAVLELLEDIKKNPTNENLLEELPERYRQSMFSRSQMKEYVLRDNPPGDRWALWVKQLEASQYITNEVMKVPQAAARLTNPLFFDDQIRESRMNGAEEYYNAGLELMTYNNRTYGRQALDKFEKANKLQPGYRDVARKIEEATLLSQLIVQVNPVNYNRFGWSYWGFTNDYVQWQLVNDLNRRSWRNVRFYRADEVAGMRLQPEQVVDLQFARLDVFSPFVDRSDYTRTAQVPVRRPRPGRPDTTVYETVTARVFVTRRVVRGEADLFCTLYDRTVNRSVFSDHFPGRYEWVQETATYQGDRRALTDADWRLVNNRFQPDPSRNDIARRLIDESYQALLVGIERGVQFSNP